jgi:hypothetical protein
MRGQRTGLIAKKLPRRNVRLKVALELGVLFVGEPILLAAATDRKPPIDYRDRKKTGHYSRSSLARAGRRIAAR